MILEVCQELGLENFTPQSMPYTNESKQITTHEVLYNSSLILEQIIDKKIAFYVGVEQSRSISVIVHHTILMILILISAIYLI